MLPKAGQSPQLRTVRSGQLVGLISANENCKHSKTRTFSSLFVYNKANSISVIGFTASRAGFSVFRLPKKLKSSD